MILEIYEPSLKGTLKLLLPLLAKKSSYYEDFFANKVNISFNIPFKNGSYISRIKIKDNFSYIESNEPFNQQEIDLLNHIAKTFEEVYITQEKKLKDWLEERKQYNKR